jgi:DNA-binding NarL/FixJ family response regulator
LRALLADDHTLVRAGLRKLLESIPDIEVVGEASDGLSLLQLAQQLQPHLVLMDIAMPGLNGIEATAQADQKPSPTCKVLILSMHQNEEYVRQALASMERWPICSRTPRTLELELARQVAVLRGETYLSPAVSRGRGA